MSRLKYYYLVLLAVILGIFPLCSSFQPLTVVRTSFSSYESIVSRDSKCALPPLCNSPYLTKRGKLFCALFTSPLPFDSSLYQSYARNRLGYVDKFFVFGQPAVKDILALTQQKLRRPYEPMVLHFAGDNGVGKTRMAQAISLSLGQRCHRSAHYSCDYGDSTIEFSGSSYVGYSLESFRRDVVRKIILHVKEFPIGVVVINEFSSLSREQTRVLLPLLGRGSAFPEDSKVDLRGQLVILTTDLGSEGRTRGKKRSEIEFLVHDEFRDLYSDLAVLYMHTSVFLPVDLDVAEEIIRSEIHLFSCFKGQRVKPALNPSQTSVHFILESVKRELPAENGRCIRQKVVSMLENLFFEYENSMQLVFSNVNQAVLLDLNEDGEVYFRIPVDHELTSL